MNRSYFALLFFVFAFASPVREIKLEYTFNVNDQYEYRQLSKQTVKQTLPGMGEVNTDIELDATLQFKVVEKIAGDAKIEAQYLRLKVLTNNPMMKLDMNSEGLENSKQNRLVRSMMNKPFYFTLSKNGDVRQVEGVNNLYSGLTELGLEPEALEATRQSLQQTISEKSLQTNLELGLIFYPETKAKEGATWQNVDELVMNFVMRAENLWTLTKIEGNTATIERDGKLSTSDRERVTLMPNGIKSKSDFSGRQTLTGLVNVKTGWPTDVKTRSEIKGKMILLAGGGVPQDMDVPTEMLIESIFTITKK